MIIIDYFRRGIKDFTIKKYDRNFLAVDTEEFIALMTPHIPGKKISLSVTMASIRTGPGASGAKRHKQETDLDTTATPEEALDKLICKYMLTHMQEMRWR